MQQWRINAVLALTARGLLRISEHRLVYVGRPGELGLPMLDEQTATTFQAMRYGGLVTVGPSTNRPFLTDQGLGMLTRAFTASQLDRIGEIPTLPAVV